MGKVPDGIYELSDAVRVARRLGADEVAFLRRVRDDLARGGVSEEEAREQIRSRVPVLAPLLSPQAGVLAAWLTLLITILIAVHQFKSTPARTVEQYADVIVNSLDVDSAGSDRKSATSPDDSTLARIIAEVRRQEAEEGIQPGQKVGRNEPCPCGSGKKFKYCHPS